MNIKQALKAKNKLISQINEAWAKAQAYNSVEDGVTRPYDPREALNEWERLTIELVGLKAKIHLANGPVYTKIFALSELKSQAKLLNSLNCSEGIERNMYSRNSEPISKTAIINIVERDKRVKELEADIEELQDSLDRFNAITEI